MTIEICEPELEQLLRERMVRGQNLERVLLEALRTSRSLPDMGGHEKSLYEVFAMARGLGDGLDFSRNR